MSELADLPLLTAEFLAVDTETNGLARDACELTEVGAVLVGGGELHDRWSSLVGVSQPLSRGIQRFTGISQAMVDAAPPPERVLPELAHAAPRARARRAQRRASTRACCARRSTAPRSTWPDPPVLCTVALARRLAPLQRRRGLAALADALGIEVSAVHRALPDAETCARVFCALFSQLCAHATTIGEALDAACARSAPARPRAPKPERRPRHLRPDMSGLPKDPGVYVFRDADGRPLYVGKSVCLRTRARAHFTTPGEWTGQAEHVDYQPTQSELGALVLENRLIKALKPPGNKKLKKTPDGYVYLRCRLDIAFPILEVAPEPAPGHSVTIGPLRGRAAAAELVEQLNSLFSLRHCGRKLPRRDHPSAYGQMGRCLSPCLQDLDPNLYRERLDSALGLFQGPDGGASLLAHVEAQMRAAAAAAAASSAPPGCAAATRACARCSSGSAACCARSTRAPGSCSPRTRATPRGATRSGSSAAASSTGARCRRTPTSSPRAPPTRCARPRGRSSAAGCARTRSPRRGSSACGSPRTRRACTS